MPEVYLTGKVEDNVLNAAIEINGTKMRTAVTAVSDIEAELQATFRAIVKAVEKESGDIHLHTDFKSPIGYLTGNFKPISDIAKKFVKNVDKIKKQNNIDIIPDSDIPKEKAEKLYQVAYKQKSAKVEKPLEKPKREIKGEVGMLGWQRAAAVGKTPLPRWSVKVFQDDKCIIDISNLDFSGYNEQSARKDAIYLADWYEQVEGATVVRNNLPAHQNDFSNYKGFNGTAIDVDKEKMTIWKDGSVYYQGEVLREYKKKYAIQHPDSKWAKELAEEEAAKPAPPEKEPEPEEEYEQLNLF